MKFGEGTHAQQVFQNSLILPYNTNQSSNPYTNLSSKAQGSSSDIYQGSTAESSAYNSLQQQNAFKPSNQSVIFPQKGGKTSLS